MNLKKPPVCCTDLLACRRCGEDAILMEVNAPGTMYFARVRRFSKCRFYKAARTGNATCKTICHDTAAEAVAGWNQSQAG